MKPLKSKCPYCRAIFPARSSQIFCRRQHGYAYRNRINRHSNIDLQIEYLDILTNIKKLSRACAGDIASMSKKEFSELDITIGLYQTQLSDAEYAAQLGVREVGTFEETGGYIIHTFDDWVHIYPPGWEQDAS